jgi:hypothetical protein
MNKPPVQKISVTFTNLWTAPCGIIIVSPLRRRTVSIFSAWGFHSASPAEFAIHHSWLTDKKTVSESPVVILEEFFKSRWMRVVILDRQPRSRAPRSNMPASLETSLGELLILDLSSCVFHCVRRRTCGEDGIETILGRLSE